jgi:hypothetical protein
MCVPVTVMTVPPSMLTLAGDTPVSVTRGTTTIGTPPSAAGVSGDGTAVLTTERLALPMPEKGGQKHTTNAELRYQAGTTVTECKRGASDAKTQASPGVLAKPLP